MKYLTLIFLLFVTSCAQVAVTINGRVLAYYAEATTDYSTYKGHIYNGNVLFRWASKWRSVNTAHDRTTPLKCDFGTFDNYHQHWKQTCDIKHYFVISWDNDQRYCLTDLETWNKVAIGQYVKVSVTGVGDIECAG